MKLADELKAAGYEKTAVDFQEHLADLFANLFPGWTDEDVVCRPDDAKRLCLAVRQATGCPHLCDYLICRALTNWRKRARVKLKSKK